MPPSPRNLRRGIPTIACYNRATLDIGCDFNVLVKALQIYVDKHIAPVWGTPARVVKANTYREHAWTLVLLDRYRNPEDRGVDGYHLTREGLPKSVVFVKSSLESADSVALAASHEIVEMLVDPAVNLYSLGPRPNTFYAYESSDPVEESFRRILDLEMSNFVYPEYFEDFHKRGSMKFDWMGEVDEPFQIMPGGYQSMFTRGKWVDKTVTASKKRRFEAEDRRGHRSLYRRRVANFTQRRTVIAVPQPLRVRELVAAASPTRATRR